MCSDCRQDHDRMIREVEEAYTVREERWAIIENDGKEWETVPEISLQQLTNKVIYTLKQR